MDTTEQALLAYGIAEYDFAITHIAALRSVGVRVPYIIDGRMHNELTALAMRWQIEQGEPVLHSPAEVVIEARAWLTQHGDELERLTNRE